MSANIHGNASFHNLKHYFKVHGKLSKNELKAVIITIIVLAFITGFDDGAKTFVFNNWIANFITVLIIVTIAVAVKQFGYRLGGAIAGFEIKYQIWWYGAAVALIIAIISKGRIWLLIPGAVMCSHSKINRLGFFRYGANVKAMSMIPLASNLSLLFFGAIIKSIDVWFFSGSNTFIDKLFLFTIFYAAWSLLPIPPLDGSKLMFQSRLVYAFVFGCFAGYAILLALGVYSYFWALIIGIFVWFTYYMVFEKTAWKG